MIMICAICEMLILGQYYWWVVGEDVAGGQRIGQTFLGPKSCGSLGKSLQAEASQPDCSQGGTPSYYKEITLHGKFSTERQISWKT